MLANRILWLALIALVLAGSAAAAQDVSPLSGYSLSVGAFRPSASSTRDNLGATWLDVRLGWKMPNVPIGDQQLEVGYLRASGETLTGGVKTKARIIPLAYTYRTPTVPGARFYTGGGIGAYFTKIEGLNSAGAPTAGASESKTKFGLHALVGMKVAPRIDAELRYTWISSKLAAQKLSGFTLSLCGTF